MAVAAAKAPFRVGAKEVFLPNFTVTLLNTTRLPPTFAKFIVPLSMNKLDFRDYLYHAYNVRVVSVRSYIEQSRVQEFRTKGPLPAIKQWNRPRAIKKMTVELEAPFVWPAQPESLAEWGQDTFTQAAKENEKYSERGDRLADAKFDVEDRKSVKEQAKRLREGKEVWRPADGLGRAR